MQQHMGLSPAVAGELVSRTNMTMPEGKQAAGK